MGVVTGSPNNREEQWDNERQVRLSYATGFRQYGLLSRRRSPESYEVFFFFLSPRVSPTSASPRREKPRAIEGPAGGNAAGRLSVFLLNKLHVNEKQRVTDRKGPGWMAR